MSGCSGVRKMGRPCARSLSQRLTAGLECFVFKDGFCGFQTREMALNVLETEQVTMDISGREPGFAMARLCRRRALRPLESRCPVFVL